ATINGTANGTVNAAAASTLVVTAPANATAGSAFSVTVTAKDAFNHTVTAYAGAVHFTSNDVQAVLPVDSTLTSGTANFNVTLKTAGSKSVVATDTNDATIKRNATVTGAAID